METRPRLLRIALEVFAERGTDGGSMREIAGRAGVNIATLYHHFGSKRGLYLAVFEELGFVGYPERPPAWVRRLRGLAPERVLEELCLGTWRWMAKGTDVFRLAGVEALKGDADARAAFAAFRDEGERFLEHVLAEVGLAREGRTQALAFTMSRVVWATFADAVMFEGHDGRDLRTQARLAASVLARGIEA